MKIIVRAASLFILAGFCFWVGIYYANSKIDQKRSVQKSNSEIARSIYHLVIYSKLLGMIESGSKKDAQDIVYREMDLHVFELNKSGDKVDPVAAVFNKTDLKNVCERLRLNVDLERLDLCDFKK